MRAIILSGAGRYADPWHPYAETSARLAELAATAGYDVEVHELAFVREYISANHEFADVESRHHLECYFRCSIREGAGDPKPAVPDIYQIGITWLDIDELAGCPIYPKALREAIPAYLAGHGTTYLGDVN